MRKLGTWVTRPEGVEAFQEQGELGGEKLALPICNHEPFSDYLYFLMVTLKKKLFTRAHFLEN